MRYVERLSLWLSFHLKVFTFLVLTTSNSLAELQPADIRVPLIITPILGAAFGYDDNIFLENSNGKSSFITQIKPSVNLGTESGLSTLDLHYAMDIGEYENSQSDSFVDNKLRVKLHSPVLNKATIDFRAIYSDDHEPRGTGYSRGEPRSIDVPDRYRDIDVLGQIGYGGEQSSSKLSLTADGLRKTYTNRRIESRYRDRDRVGAGLNAQLRIRPNTDIYLKTDAHLVNYRLEPLNEPTLDSIETQVSAGTSWKYSAATQGSVQLGIKRKDFEHAGRKVFLGLVWEMDVVWRPTVLSKINIRSWGITEESDLVGDFVETRSGMMTIAYHLQDRLQLTMNTNLTRRDYRPTTFAEGIVSGSLGLNYEARRWVVLGVNAKYSIRRSNYIGMDYVRRVVDASILVSL